MMSCSHKEKATRFKLRNTFKKPLSSQNVTVADGDKKQLNEHQIVIALKIAGTNDVEDNGKNESKMNRML